jgi:hypothetical protein
MAANNIITVNFYYWCSRNTITSRRSAVGFLQCSFHCEGTENKVQWNNVVVRVVVLLVGNDCTGGTGRHWH